MKRRRRKIKNLWFAALIVLILAMAGFGLYWWGRISVAPTAELQNVKMRIEQEKAHYEEKEKSLRAQAKLKESQPELPSVLEDKLADWTRAWRRAVPGFKLADFVRVEEKPMAAARKEFYQKSPRESLREKLYVYSPDKKKFLDPYGGVELSEQHGVIRALRDIDSAVFLIDLENKTINQILFAGSSAGFDGGCWLDNDNFVVVGFTEFRPRKMKPQRIDKGWTIEVGDFYYVPVLYKFSLFKNRMISYYGPEIKDEVFFGVVRKAVYSGLQKKLNIVFD